MRLVQATMGAASTYPAFNAFRFFAEKGILRSGNRQVGGSTKAYMRRLRTFATFGWNGAKMLR